MSYKLRRYVREFVFFTRRGVSLLWLYGFGVFTMPAACSILLCTFLDIAPPSADEKCGVNLPKFTSS